MSYIEKTARKLYPILSELKKRMVPEKKRIQSSSKQKKSRSSKSGRILTIDANDENADEESDSDQLLIDLSRE